MTLREGMRAGEFSERDLHPEELYERIREGFLREKDSFLPRIYDLEAVRITLDKYLRHMPFYVTGGVAFRLTITRNDEVYLSRMVSLSPAPSPQALARIFWFFETTAEERKTLCYGSSYDQVVPLYADVAPEVREGYELAIVSPELVKKTKSLPLPHETFSLPYFPDDFSRFPLGLIHSNEFMAYIDLKSAEELVEELVIHSLEVRGAVGVYSESSYPLLLLKKRMESVGMKTELRKVFEYRGRPAETPRGRRLVERGKKTDLPIYLLIGNELIKVVEGK